jgi:hypothetical protein
MKITTEPAKADATIRMRDLKKIRITQVPFHYIVQCWRKKERKRRGT